MGEKVALVRYMPLEQTVQIGDKTYAFVNRGGVSLCYVDPEDVEAVLQVTKVCCGGRKRRIFQHANQAQIDFWERLG